MKPLWLQDVPDELLRASLAESPWEARLRQRRWETIDVWVNGGPHGGKFLDRIYVS